MCIRDRNEGMVFIHPFDDPLVIAGQGTVAKEIVEEFKDEPDIFFIPVGGGGLLAGCSIINNSLSPKTKLIGVETKFYPSLYNKFYKKKFFLHYGDIIDSLSVDEVIRLSKPNEIYNLAAQSHVAVSFKMPLYTSEVTALGLSLIHI